MSQKRRLFIDADDTILKSSEAVVKILNKRYSISPEKTVDDLRDWNYRSIHKYMTPEKVEDIYSSEEFFNTVEINSDFTRFYFNNLDKFEIYIVTKGTKENLQKKKYFLEANFPEINFIGIVFEKDEDSSQLSKSSVNMFGGIQIDDNTSALTETNAKWKILIKNYRDLPWNQTPINETNVYAVNNWEEIEEVVNFLNNYGEMI